MKLRPFPDTAGAEPRLVDAGQPSPPLSMTSSAAAKRCSRPRAAMIAHGFLAEARCGHDARHLDFFRTVDHRHAPHATAVATGFDQQRHRQHDVGCPGDGAAAVASARIMGCRMASSLALACASEKARRRMAARSSAVRLRYLAPKALRIGPMAAPPGAVNSLAMASVSTTAAPSSSNRVAAALLPLPMPPVRPTMNVMA